MIKTCPQQPQFGFTLVELVLVLVILVAVSAVVVPLFDTVASTPTASATAGNLQQTTRLMERFRLASGVYPNRLDLLLTDHQLAMIAPAVNRDGTLAIGDGVTDEVNVIESDGEVVRSLLAAMVDESLSMSAELIENPANPIFGVGENHSFFSADGRVVPIALNPDGTPASPEHVVVLGTAATQRLGLTGSNDRFVLLGIGNNNSAIGDVIASAPFHLRDDANAVTDIYSRFLGVFRVPGAGQPEFEASLVAVVAIERNAADQLVVVGLQQQLARIYDQRNFPQ